MSTRSRIGMEDTSGRVRSIYCHFDGYPSGVGRRLLDHWNTTEQINALLDLGDLSVLGEVLGEDRGTGWFDQRNNFRSDSPEWEASRRETLAYRRDRGEENVDAIRHPKDDWPDYGQEWEYLFVPSLGQWFVRDAYLHDEWGGIPDAITAEEARIAGERYRQAAAALDTPDNTCDNCGRAAELFHNEATGLALCEVCDLATEREEGIVEGTDNIRVREYEDGKLTLTIDTSVDLGTSKSGKSSLVATSHGEVEVIEGLFLNLNAYRKPVAA